jgi:branched-chain amino acid transport system permease protein
MTEKPSSTSTVGRGKWIKPAVWVGVLVILALFPLFIKSPYHLHILNLTFIYVIATVSFRTIAISGQFPLAHAAFMGIGAYLAGMASKWFGWPPWLTMPLAALASAGIGMLIGYPFARLRALYYALGTLFFGIAVTTVIIALPKWTGGSPGLTGIEPLFTTTSKIPYFYFFLGLTALSLVILYRFEFCRIGTSLKAIAQSYLVAASVGINEEWNRILVVGVGCFFAGLAGAAYAHYNMVLSYYTFNFGATLWIVMYALIGGIGNFAGPIIGTAILVIIPEVFRDLKTFSPYISAGILIIVVYLMPKGLVGLPQLVMSLYKKIRKGERIAHAS